MVSIKTETLYWIPAAERKPDDDRTVLVHFVQDAVDQWASGWWDARSNTWRHVADAMPIDDAAVTHWADVAQPAASGQPSELAQAAEYALDVLQRNRSKQARLRAIERLQKALCIQQAGDVA